MKGFGCPYQDLAIRESDTALARGFPCEEVTGEDFEFIPRRENVDRPVLIMTIEFTLATGEGAPNRAGTGNLS